LKQAQRRSLGAGDLTDEELAAIARAEIPARAPRGRKARK
jgi:hypothetical protein